jgi:hypothetical protein
MTENDRELAKGAAGIVGLVLFVVALFYWVA